MTRRVAFLVLCAVCLLVAALRGHAAEVTAEQSGQNVIVKIDGKLFTEYVVDNGPKPILWPIIGPTGKPMTRAYPMVEGDPTEREDHRHHRSLWFTHDDVNGEHFWHENKDHAVEKHRKYVKVESGEQAVIVAQTDWLGADGKKVCEDERTITFGTAGNDARWIDYRITIKATEGPVKFGDTKEGTMGIRVAGTMKQTAKPGGKIVNSEGQIDKDAWGKRAAWVDYHGPVDGQTVGVAVLNHPSSFRFPTYWHVRTYGLFTANPFGVRAFTRAPNADGSYTIPAGGSLTMRHRFLFHKGDEKAGKVAEAFAAYAKQKD